MTTHETRYQGGGNIWFGVAVGILLGGGGLYFLGTKDGRKLLKKIIALAEDMELSLEDVVNEVEELFESENPVIDGQGNMDLGRHDNINTVLDKIKHVFPHENETKRYFVKEGRIQKGS